MIKGRRYRYFGPFKQEWYSVCSAHQGYDSKCPRCNAGNWTNIYIQKIDHFIYNKYKPLWLWWHNRRNSKTNSLLKSIFPNLNKDK